MGGTGSGAKKAGTPLNPKPKAPEKKEPKPKEVDAIQALIDLDPEFRKHVIEQFKAQYDNSLKVLLEIRDRRVTDEKVDQKTGKTIIVKVPNDVRIKAISQWFKMTGDKTIADKKDSGHDKDKGNTGDLTKALLAAEERMAKKREEAEAAAKEAGKLVSIADTKEAVGG